MHRNSLAVAISLIVASMGSPASLCAAPLFYLSDQPLGIAQPGTFSLNNPLGGATGQLNIYAMTDVRLAGVSLDLLETGGAIKFRGLDVVNDGRWWILDGPQVIEDSKITSIGGGSLPGFEGAGIGPGDFVDTNFHPTSGYLLATVGYEVVDASLTSTFELRVGRNVIADWHGASPMVHFDDYSQPSVPGTYPALPALTNPPPPQPQPPLPDPVRPAPAPPLNQPGIVDPPPRHEPVSADPGEVIGPIDVPLPMNRFVPTVLQDEYEGWSAAERGLVPLHTIYGPPLWVPAELQDEYEIWIAAERALIPVYDDGSYSKRVDSMPTRDNGLPVGELFHDTTAISLFGTLAEADSLQLTPSVPEPATMALSGLTFIALLGLWRRRPG